MTTTLFAIWLHVAAMSPSRIAPADASAFFADAIAAVEAEGGTVDELELVTTFGVCEGAGRRDVVGDSGAAVGAWQLHAEHWRSFTRAEVLADRVLQARLWLLSLREAVASCGSVERALGRLAVGRCGGAPKLVARRIRGRC